MQRSGVEGPPAAGTSEVLALVIAAILVKVAAGGARGPERRDGALARQGSSSHVELGVEKGLLGGVRKDGPGIVNELGGG